MSERRIELPSTEGMSELLEARTRARQEQTIAEAAILGVLSEYQENQTPVRIVGFPLRVVMPRHDSNDTVISRTAIYVEPAFSTEDSEPEPRSIDQGLVVGVRREMQRAIISIEPAGTDTWWQFGLDSIVEIEAVGSLEDQFKHEA